MEEFCLLVNKVNNDFVVMGEGNKEELTNILKVIKENFKNAKVIQVDKERYTEDKKDLKSLFSLIEQEY